MGISASAYKTYEWERETWPEFREVKMTRAKAQVYLNKLARHFKTDEVTAVQSYRRGGAAWYWAARRQVGLASVCNMGSVCHEFAHHLVESRWGKQKRCHGKKFKKELMRVYNWAKRWLPKQ